LSGWGSVVALGTVLLVTACGGVDAGSTASETGAASAGSASDMSAVPGAPRGEGAFGFGRPATPEAIALWDIDVGPDGAGLPPGSGTAAQGAEVYSAYCVACHGADGGGGPNAALVSAPGTPFPSGALTGVPSTIGNYWPYATTVFDYTRRAMPFDRPGILTDEQVYAVTAWILWKNGLIPENEAIDASSLPAVSMPGKEHFVPTEDVPIRALP
jgi:S-disulfanyl-L-cysteine oxidoreductase SoxD